MTNNVTACQKQVYKEGVRALFILSKNIRETRKIMSPKNVRVSLGALFFMLSEKALDEFKKIYKEEYGENVSNQKASELATNLLVFFDHSYFLA